MQKVIILLVGCLTGTVLAQTLPNQPAQTLPNPQVISSQPGSVAGPGSLMITNAAGGTFALSELEAQLANLKADVERTLPLLSATTGQAPNANLSRGQELANAASNILARALSRTNQNNALPQGGTSSRNFAGFLRSLISTNTGGGGGVSFDPNTLNQLATLQNQLRPVLSTLETLNLASVGGVTNQPSGTVGQPGGVFSPTGR